MMNLKQLFREPSIVKVNKVILVALILVSLAGFIDATYLTTKHYLGEPIRCSLLSGCEEVTSSKYSVMLGMPVALYGALYYLTILVLTVLYLDTKRNAIMSFLAKFTVVGFIASVYFMFLQTFVIKAFCLYCIFSAVSSTALFVIGLIILKGKRT